MQRALAEFVLEGVETALPFHRQVMEESSFRAGDLSIRYLEEHPELSEAPALPLSRTALFAALAAQLERDARAARTPPRLEPGTTGGSERSAWQATFTPGRGG
jgi:pyruvate carboxylase